MNRDRFSGLRDGWARLDGAAGSQVVDGVIEAMADWMRSGSMANHGGAFKHAHETDELVHSTRAACATLLGGEPNGIFFGPSFTATTMRFAATVVRELAPGDEIVCSRLDHDSNVRPWVIAAERAGVTVRFAEPEADTLELPASAVEAVLSDRTRWVAVTAASNAVGTVPDLEGIVAAAHGVGARVYLDAVHATPHRRYDLATLGADVIACSAYKWFGPHISVLCATPRSSRTTARTSSTRRRRRRRTGGSSARCRSRAWRASVPRPSTCSSSTSTPSAPTRSRCSHTALEGLGAMDHVTLYGAAADRAPTLMFNVAGMTPRATWRPRSPTSEIAVWDGNYYAWELEQVLGLAPHGARPRRLPALQRRLRHRAPAGGYRKLALTIRSQARSGSTRRRPMKMRAEAVTGTRVGARRFDNAFSIATATSSASPPKRESGPS